MNTPPDTSNRYLKQCLFGPIGRDGQRVIEESCALVLGCGALGSLAADRLARAGVGTLRLVDRDFVELENLQRQALYDEEDARRRLPKAVAAANRLEQINSCIDIDPIVADFAPRNAEELVEGADVAIDATDNMEARFLLNDAAFQARMPWVYGGVISSTGCLMPIIPDRTACLRCLMEEKPSAGTLPTCEGSGVLNAAPGAVASLQSGLALRLLVSGDVQQAGLLYLDTWEGDIRRLQVERKEDCPACGKGDLEYLSGRGESGTFSLCGREAVQVSPAEKKDIDLAALSDSLSDAADIQYNGYLLTVHTGEVEIILFPDGRAIIKGTTDETRARSLYARYVGT